jgi:protein HOOK3
LQSLEKQNADLVDKNAVLEEDYRKVATFKPLMDTYKNQISDLETRVSQRTTELEDVRFELDQTKAKLRSVEAEKARDAETLDLYQERVKELELSGPRKPSAKVVAPPVGPTLSMSSDTVSTTLDAEISLPEDVEEAEEDGATSHGLGGELDDALSGTTTTDLKLQIGKLRRELEAAKSQQAEASRVLVLENLLDDARRMKSRYEQDYLTSHREKLKLQSDLEEIRSGKALGDGTEAAIALRQRLNEMVEELDTLRREHAELEVKFDAQTKDLTITKSDRKSSFFLYQLASIIDNTQ